MLKNFVFDTNVLLHDPQAIFKFEDNHIIIPIYVIEEMDTFKKGMNELGRNAREFTRILDKLRFEGHLRDGVALPEGGTLRVAFSSAPREHEFLSREMPDNLILAVALETREQQPDTPCILLTKDVNLRVRADALGLDTENYEERGVITSETFPGACELAVPNALINELHRHSTLEISLGEHTALLNAVEDGTGSEVSRFYANQYALLKNAEGGQQSSFARIIETSDDGTVATLRPLGPRNEPVWSVKPRNKEQLYCWNKLVPRVFPGHD